MNAAAAAFVLGPALALGSFLNVVVARVPERRSIFRPPSSCGSCGTEILWRDNVPLVSWLVLRGRCRHCHARISRRYPAVEAVTAVLVVACVAVLGPTPYTALAAGLCAALVALSAIDVQRRIVPDRIVLPAAAFALAAHTVIDPSPERAVSALAAGGALFLAVLAHPRGLGLGDMKVAALLGAVLGATVSVAIVLGALAALVAAALLVARHGPAARTPPLVPFLAVGAVVALFAGEQLVAVSLSLL